MKAYKHETICPECNRKWTFVDYRGVAEAEVRKHVDPRCDDCLGEELRGWGGYVFVASQPQLGNDAA